MPGTPATPRPTSGSCASTRPPTTRCAPSTRWTSDIHRVATKAWDDVVKLGERNGYRNAQASTIVPERVDVELAELVGYFMGDGSLHAKGIRLCVADTDPDVTARLTVLSKGLFNLVPVVSQQPGYQEVTLQSVRLARWWQAAGFAKDLPGVDHTGKGWTPRVPAAILETNDPAVYAAFLRGLFEADGAVLEGVPSVATSAVSFADDVRTLLLALGYPTTTRTTVSGFLTIGFMMDCDTTGIEPDFSLVKFKKLVGWRLDADRQPDDPAGPQKLGYQQETIEAIVEYIADKGHVIDAPGLKPEHYEVFDCAMGARAISRWATCG
jgi:hypothetical protein